MTAGRNAAAVIAAVSTLMGMAYAASAPVDLHGVYQSIPDGTTLPGGLKNSGSPAELPLLPAAIQQAKSTDLKQDPWNTCQPVGPFRMMAKPRLKIEIFPTAPIVMIVFEDVAHGVLRPVYMTHGHPETPEEPMWLGHAVGRWENGALVIDTNGFNDRTWLNDNGAPHSADLHLLEHIRPILNGKYLEYRMTAEDPKVLAKPYTYIRYFQKLDTELADDVCQDVTQP